jgi:membrane protein implicated in regulation of membrane protease activity
MDWLWWLGAALLLIAIEVMTVDLVLLMFAGGAVAAGIANLLGASLPVQIVLFAVVSVLLLVSLRPWLLRQLRSRVPLIETNVAAQVGRTAIAVQDVDVHGGRVKLSGEVWSARAAREGAVFPVDAELRVVRIDGATAVVDDAGVAWPRQAGSSPDSSVTHPPSRPRAHRPEETA